MTREAAIEGVERFVDRTVDATRREFKVGRALRGTGLGPGGALVDRLRNEADALERRVVEPELDTYRRRSIEQFEVVLAYAESDDPIDAFADELLERDSYLESLDPAITPETRDALVDDLLARLERLGEGIEPIVRRPEDAFWPAVVAAYDRPAAIELVEEGFPFTGPLRDHRDAFAFTVEIDPGSILGGVLANGLPTATIDYTDEAIRAMRRAERQVVHETKDEVKRRFATGDTS